MQIGIEGSDLPGRTCGPGSDLPGAEGQPLCARVLPPAITWIALTPG
ncbi:hypothetical protein [Streptomyces sp. NPDC005969]